MSIAFSYTYGTNANDLFLNNMAFSINFGLKGNDHFFVATNTFLTVLAGGPGDDIYEIHTSAIVADYEGLDLYYLPLIYSANAYVATVDGGRHALYFDNVTKSWVGILDMHSGGYANDYVFLGDTSFNLGAAIANIGLLPNYIGDYRWEELGAIGLTPLSRADVAQAGQAANEAAWFFQERADVQQIALLYEASLGRKPDVEGLNFWIDVFEGGWPMERLSFEFLNSDEFESRAGVAAAMSVGEFVDTMYLNILDRPADAAGHEFWSDQIGEAGLTYEDILTYFSTSPENYAQAGYLASLAEVEPGYWDWA